MLAEQQCTNIRGCQLDDTRPHHFPNWSQFYNRGVPTTLRHGGLELDRGKGEYGGNR